MSFDPQKYTTTNEAFTSSEIQFDILQIANISTSKLRQLDEWKEYQDPKRVAVDRMGNSKIIRSIDNEESDSIGSVSAIYKLLLRDTAGNVCYAYEYNDKLSFLHQKKDTKTPPGISLGGRLVVNRGTLIMNGVLMLKNAQCKYLGIVDDELAQTLNSGIGKKQIEILETELKAAST